MKVKMKAGSIEDDVSIDGLFECVLTHEIKATKGSISWNGPKMPVEMWQQILSYFKWCYDTTRSECQVRLYVSPVHNTWRAWAFPQEAKTGMTARELDDEDARTQRANLNMNPPEWYYFGTVHHHCGATAFQSGTDEQNEKDQDGLHITIGKVDEKLHDIHARFYRKGLKFDPDMSWFWDVEATVEACPEQFRQFLPKDYKDKMARAQMCVPSTVDFPPEWKANLKEIKPAIITPSNYPHSGYTGHTTYPTGVNLPSRYSSENTPFWQRCQNGWEELVHEAVKHQISPEDLSAMLDDMNNDMFLYGAIARVCRHHKVDPEDLVQQKPLNLEADYVEEALDQQHTREKENGTAPKTEGSGAGSESAAGNGSGPGSGADELSMEEKYYLGLE